MTKDTPHHQGHRDRLRERFIKGGAAALADYELLELLLFMAIPRRDVKPLAKSLIHHFGSLPAVLQAPHDQLAAFKGLSETSAIAIQTVSAAATHLVRADIIDKPVISSWQALLDYCYIAMAREKREHFRVLFLNKKNELIKDEVQQTGTVDHTPAYPREIIKRALEIGATAIILAHNHPSGDARPSHDDIELTNTVIEAAKPFGIVIHDHLIIARKATFSFKAQGLL
jgi:DNA repair protein RadC